MQTLSRKSVNENGACRGDVYEVVVGRDIISKNIVFEVKFYCIKNYFQLIRRELHNL